VWLQLRGLQLRGLQLRGLQLHGLQLRELQLRGLQLRGLQLRVAAATWAAATWAAATWAAATCGCSYVGCSYVWLHFHMLTFPLILFHIHCVCLRMGIDDPGLSNSGRWQCATHDHWISMPTLFREFRRKTETPSTPCCTLQNIGRVNLLSCLPHHSPQPTVHKSSESRVHSPQPTVHSPGAALQKIQFWLARIERSFLEA
jgi:hypothetical protein